MMEKGHFDKAKYDELRQLPIDLSKFKIKDHNDGIATYFREYLREHLKKLMRQLAKDDPQYRKPNGAPYDIYRDGLNIYTTIDSRVQKYAEKAVTDHLKEHQVKLFATWKDWNHPNPTISSKIKNPWSRKAYKSTDREMELRRLSLSRQMWGTDRYQRVRPQYMPTAVSFELRDIDIDRIFQVLAYDKKPRRKNKYAPRVDGKALLKSWEKNRLHQSRTSTELQKITVQ
jgi:penicillin-binding protein 1A